MKHQAVIFDLDGTLLDTLDGIAAAMNEVLKQKGFPPHPKEAYRYFVGRGIDTMVEQALPAGADKKVDMDEWAREFRRIYEDIWPKTSPPYEGIKDLLAELNKKGVHLAVLSNKSDRFTKMMVQSILKEFTFTHVLGGRAGIPQKPDPAAALEIAGETGIEPEQYIFLGDTGVDMSAANQAGMYGVGALWGFREREELLENGAAKLIDHPLELLDLFNSP